MFRPPAFTPGMIAREPVVQTLVCLDAARLREELLTLERVLSNLAGLYGQFEMELTAVTGLLDQRQFDRFAELGNRVFAQARFGLPIAQGVAQGALRGIGVAPALAAGSGGAFFCREVARIRDQLSSVLNLLVGLLNDLQRLEAEFRREGEALRRRLLPLAMQPSVVGRNGAVTTAGPPLVATSRAEQLALAATRLARQRLAAALTLVQGALPLIVRSPLGMGPLREQTSL